MQLTKKKGFTLIEIVIVLAIAALILIIVFLAVTGAQRSRRDEQRRTDLNRVAAQLETWAGNHNGDYPSQGAGNQWQNNAAGAAYAGEFGTDYLGSLGNLNDPQTGTQYQVVTGDATCTGGTIAIRYNRTAIRDYDMCIGLEQGIYQRDLVTP